MVYKTAAFKEMEKAKERLKEAKEKGLEEIVWEIKLNPELGFPIHEHTFFEQLFNQKSEYMHPNEDTKKYLEILIETGKVSGYKYEKSDNQGRLYIVKGNIALDFEFLIEEPREITRKICFFNKSRYVKGVKELEDVEGKVNVKINKMKLFYQGFIEKSLAKLPTQCISKEKPDIIRVISYFSKPCIGCNMKC